MNYRALELHGRSIWNHRAIDRALETAAAYGLTTLVLHESDLMTEFIFPSAYFNPVSPWDGAPARRGENALHNNRVYLEDILRRAARKRIDVWVEVKELTFPDELVERNPALFSNGTVCPTDPLWQDFLSAKYRDLVSWYPGVRGVIVSAGSPEGRAALSQKKCRCRRCAGTGLTEWYRSILLPMYETLAPAGVRLAVREFSYSAAHQEAITAAVGTLPGDVIYCLKVTPHDFYPTFPDNALIGRIAGRETWVEYDTMGQYYGWGVVPCLVADDIRDRFAHAEACGVSGVLMRVEWERVNDWWSLESPNRMNLFAGACAAAEKPFGVRDLTEQWILEEGIEAGESGLDLLDEYLEDTWTIIRKACYMNDFVLNDSSMFPMSIERAWWSMSRKHSLVEWFPERKPDLELDAVRVEAYLAEKREAVSLAARWEKRLSAVGTGGALAAFLKKNASMLARYTEGWLHAGSVCILSAWADLADAPPLTPAARQTLESGVEALSRYSNHARTWLEAEAVRHQVWMLFNPDRADALAEGGARRLVRGPGKPVARNP